MTSSPARRLILIYAGLTALLSVYVIFAPDLSPSSNASTAFGIVLNALLLWRLWHGSAGAWLFLLVIDLLSLAAIVLMSLGLGTTSVLLIAFGAAHVTILVSNPVRAHVWTHQGPRVATG